MAYSNQRTVSDGSLRTILLAISFFDKTEITVFVNDVEQILEDGDYIWATSNSIQFPAALPSGDLVIIRRRTDISEMRHIFTEGAQFTNQTLDEDYTQMLHIAQESVEGSYTTELFNDLDMHNYKIRNLGQAVLEKDAVSLGQAREVVSASPDVRRALRAPLTDPELLPLPPVAQRAGKILGFNSVGQAVGTVPLSGSGTELALDLAGPGGSAMVGYQLSLLGTAVRTAAARFADFVSVKDFGAIGDGNPNLLGEHYATLALAQFAFPLAPVTALSDSVDWAAGYTASKVCAESGKHLYWPQGVYRMSDYHMHKVNYSGDGTRNTWVNSSMRGTALRPVGAGKPRRWTDITGADLPDFTPLVVAARSGVAMSHMSIHATASDTRWSAGYFVPSTRRNKLYNVDITGPWKVAGLYLDATWSRNNTTLTSLFPEIESDTGMNEFNAVGCFFTGLWGCVVRGTTRPASTTPWVWAGGGTSDINFSDCRFGSESPEDERKVDGGAFDHSAVIPNKAVAGQGINFMACTFRVAAKYGLRLDYSNRVTFTSCYGETINTWMSAGNPAAIFAFTSNTGSVVFVNNAVGFRQYKDGKPLSSGSLIEWQEGGIVNYRADGFFATPCIHANASKSLGLLFTSFAANGLIRFRRSEAGVATDYLYVSDQVVRPYVSGGIGLGTSTYTFGRGNFTGLMVSEELRPVTDNAIKNGSAAARWSAVFAGTGTINTSDARHKTEVRDLLAAELRVGKRLVREIGVWQWLAEVESVDKGPDVARLHIGPTVQAAIRIFREEGLDPLRYGAICYDEWEDEFVEEEGETIQTQVAGNIYGFREGQTHGLMLRAMQDTIDRLDERVTQLELIK